MEQVIWIIGGFVLGYGVMKLAIYLVEKATKKGK